jgi:hypothetical protein
MVVNEPMPYQLTVGRLREILRDAPDEAVIGLKLPPGFHGHDQLSIYVNVEASYSSGPIVLLRPVSIDQKEFAGNSGEPSSAQTDAD